MSGVGRAAFDMLGTTVALDDAPERTLGLLAALLTNPSEREPARTIPGGGSPVDVLAALTGAAVETSPLLCIHAAVVDGPHGLIAVPGHSGLGKTTLSAALVRSGFGYVSDEALALHRTSGLVSPFPRPFSIDARSWRVLGLPGVHPAEGHEWLVPADRVGRIEQQPGMISEIVLARRVAGSSRLEPASRGEAVSALLPRCFNHFREPEASFRAIVRMARGARVWRATYAEAPELAALFAQRFTAHSASPTAAR